MKKQLIIIICCWQISLVQGQWQEYQIIPIGGELGTEIHDLSTDDNGYIYAACDAGLIRYDGENAYLFKHNPGDSNSIAPGPVAKLIRGSNGILWLAMTEGTLCRFNPEFDEFKTYFPDLLHYPFIRYLTSIEEDDLGHIWIGAFHSQLFEFDPEKESFTKHELSGTDALNNSGRMYIHNIVQDRLDTNILWISIHDWNNQNYENFDCQLVRYNKKNRASQILGEYGSIQFMDEQNVCWGTGYTNYITRYDPKTSSFTLDTLRPMGSDSPLSTRISCIIDYKNQRLIGSEFGIYEFKEKVFFKSWSQTRDIGLITSFSKDQSGNLWVGTINGLYLIYESPIRHYPFQSLGTKNQIYPVYISYDPIQQNFSLSMQTFFEKMRPYIFMIPDHTNDPFKNIYLDDFPKFSCFGPSNNLWIQHVSGQLTYNNLDSSGRIKFQDKVPALNIPLSIKDFIPIQDSLISISSSNQFTILHNDGYILKNMDRKQLTAPGGQGVYTQNYLRGHIVQNDSICILFNHELVRLNINTSKVSPIRLSNEFDRNRRFFTSILLDRNENLWLTNSSSLFKTRIEEDSLIMLKKYTAFEGFKSLIIYKLYEDRSNRIWTFGYNGIHALDMKTNEIRYFGLNEGVPNLFISDEPLCELPDGRVAYTDFQNLCVFHPDTLWKSVNAPIVPVRFQEIRMDGSMLAKRDWQHGLIALEKMNQTIDVAFQGLHYKPLGSVNYFYRVKGMNNHWIGVGENNFLTLSSLNPGKYEFQVSTDPDGLSDNIASLIISVPRPFTRSYIFFFLLSITVLGCLWLLYIFSIRKITKKKQTEVLRKKEKLDLELKALRSQMNPHFMFNSLNSIRNYILNNQSEQAADYLADFSFLLRLILQYNQKRLISLKEELEVLDLYIGLEQMRFDETFEYRKTIHPDIDTDEVYVPPLITQPFVENAIWHGLLHKKGHRQLTIQVRQHQQAILEIEIRDNGVGRTAAGKYSQNKFRKKKSMGIEIARQRLSIVSEKQEIDYHLQFTDLYNENGDATGTVVKVNIPLNYNY